MKAVFSGAQMAHAPAHFISQGKIIGYPEAPERARRLLEGARQAGAGIHAARRFDLQKIGLHAKGYIDFLRNGFDDWLKIPGAGPEMMVSLRPMVKPGFTSEHIMARAGRYMMDFSCALTGQSWKSIEASAWTALTAADMVLKGEPVVYALCRPPGHHAYVNRASGFCYLNNSGLAAQALRGVHDRVAILDIDVHHGNGTQALFYNRPDVLTVSIHADPAEYYPFYWGSAGETGEAEGLGFNLNLPVPVRSGDDVWRAALEQALERILAFEPGALVVALGLDAHEADPLKGGAVTQGGFANLAAAIASLDLPTVIVQEGGYLTEHLGDNLAMFLSAFEGAREDMAGGGAAVEVSAAGGASEPEPG